MRLMANYRQIHVSIWKDCWFLDLEPQEKLLFIYLFSNSETSMAGIYKIPFKVICFETGLSGEFVQTAIDSFTEDGKMMYEDGVIWIKNMMKFHSSKSPKVQTRIDNDLKNIPNCNVKIQYLYTIDTGSYKEEEEDIEEDKDKDVDKKKRGKPPLPQTPKEAEGDIDIILFSRITDRMPGISDYGLVIEMMNYFKEKIGSDTEVMIYLTPYWQAWDNRQYSPNNYAWLTEWAVNGNIPKAKVKGETPDSTMAALDRRKRQADGE